jgi:hypothetical protein
MPCPKRKFRSTAPVPAAIISAVGWKIANNTAKAPICQGNSPCWEKNGPEDSGLAKVVDLSTTGLKLKLNVPRTFPVGAKLLVEFRLDDRKRTPMEKRVIVRNVSGLYVGASFHPNEPDDPALGFYLMR